MGQMASKMAVCSKTAEGIFITLVAPSYKDWRQQIVTWRVWNNMSIVKIRAIHIRLVFISYGATDMNSSDVDYINKISNSIN